MSYISVAARQLLQKIANSEDGEIVYENRGDWWVDTDRVRPSFANELLRLCLIKQTQFTKLGAGMERYEINQEGLAILADPEYVPQIVSALRKRPSVEH